MRYICAGLYAEGPTDYRFLEGLLSQILHPIAWDVFAGRVEVAEEIVGIEASLRAAIETVAGKGAER